MDTHDPLNLRVCRACLATDVKLYNLHKLDLADTFSDITRTSVEYSDGLPQYVCYYCRSALRRCLRFRDHCQQAHYFLQEMRLQQLVLTTEYIQLLEKQKFSSPLTKQACQTSDYLPKDTIDGDDGEYIEEDGRKEELASIDHLGGDHSSYSDHYDDHDNLRNSDDDDDKEKIKELPCNAFDFEEHKMDIETDVKEGIIEEVDRQKLKKEKDSNDEIVKEKLKKPRKAKATKVVKKKKEIKEKSTSKKPVEKKQAKKKSKKYNEKSEEDFEEFSRLYNVEVVCLTLEQQIARVQERRESRECKQARMSCHLCYKGFMTETAYKRHMKMHDPSSGAFSCAVCLLRYPTQRVLRAHMRLHKREFLCSECGHVNNSTTRAKQHSKWHKGFKYECKICQKQCNTQTTYMAHKREAHKPVSCEQCGEQLVGTQELAKHRTQVHEQSCMSCGTVFQSAEALQRHKGDATGCDTITISCWICGANFPFKSSLHAHIEQQHGGKGGVYTCEECGAVFSSDRSLGIHYAYNHSKRVKHHSRRGEGGGRGGGGGGGARPAKDAATAPGYLCEICAKSFPCPAKLKVHLQIHTGEKPYRCPMCPKAFRTKSALEIHINVHTGERPYKCRLCAESFKSYAQRYKHNLMVHTRERRHKCLMCDKTYVIAYDLKAHVRFAHLHQPRPPRSRPRHHPRPAPTTPPPPPLAPPY